MQKILFLFGELNDDDIDWMIGKGSVEKIPTGTVLIKEGHPIDRFYILLEGKVSVSIAVFDSSQEIATLTRGEVFGEMSFMDTRLPSASVETVEDALVLSISREQLASRLNQDVGFASRFYRAIAIFLSSRLRNTVKYLGYDKEYLSSELDLDQEELAEDVLEKIPMAKARFDWLLRRLKNTIK